MAAAAPAISGIPTATQVRLGGDSHETRFVVDLSKRVPLNAFTLADPYRVVVDIPQVAFDLERNVGSHGRGLVKEFRYGMMMAGASRIVLDLTGPVRIARAFSLAAGAGQPARLVVDLKATDREGFMHRLALEDRVTPMVSAAAPEPKQAAVPGDHRPVVVLDPGHGGIDDGTHAPSGETEKHIVLGFAKRLRDDLEATGKYRVLMTRSTDVYIPLDQRVHFARAHKAALFVSIHADALPRREGQASGATIYTLSKNASDPEAAREAEQENHSDVIAGVDLSHQKSDVANILLDLAERETHVFSLQFAHVLKGDLKPVAPLHKQPIRSADFRVLTSPDVPSVLIELGYVTNPGDLKRLNSSEWQERTAQAMVDAINSYFLSHLAGTTVAGGQQ